MCVERAQKHKNISMNHRHRQRQHNKMALPRGPNPLAHLISRQSGDNVDRFRANLFSERMNIAKNLYRRNLVSHFGCVNAIEFSNEGELLISGNKTK